ncbi:MAG: VOC family protein [Xanthomonadales bacterium]|nr:VOC family protein [Xanthomonadales bacterium]
MSHRSLLTTLMIDCLDEHFDQSYEFWSGALGLAGRRPRAGQKYATLGRLEIPLVVRMQRVHRDPGYHLDISTNDMRAERERMLANGARAKYRIKRWWVMEDPSGNAFCLIRPEEGFDQYAKEWNDEP